MVHKLFERELAELRVRVGLFERFHRLISPRPGQGYRVIAQGLIPLNPESPAMFGDERPMNEYDGFCRHR